MGVVTNCGYEKCVFTDKLFTQNRNFIEYPNFQKDTKMYKDVMAILEKYKLHLVVPLNLVVDTSATIPE